MRIAYVSAGAAGMLCGSCLHDNTLAVALRRMGHDVALIPTYTPMRTDDRDESLPEVFYGAVNLYLQQISPLFRHTPRFIDRLLDSPALLRWVSRRGSSVSPAALGALAISVLEGEQGRQRKELERLAAWLRDEFRPELVHLTNSMFLGFAGPLKRILGVPVICSVQGEDLFLDGMPERHRAALVSLLRLKAKDADGFIATSRYYAAHMATLLDLDPDRLQVVHLGINLEGHAEARAARRPAGGPFTIGYMARVCPEKGLHLLVEALDLLSREAGTGRARVLAAGYLGPGDRAYFDGVTRSVAERGLQDSFQYLGEIDRAAKLRLLGSLDALSVPAVYREPKGLYVLEAMATGVPVVQPEHGAFPELIAMTGGGILFEPGSAPALARALLSLLREPSRAGALGQAGASAVSLRFTDRAMAEATIRVYLAVLSEGRGAAAARR